MSTQRTLASTGLALTIFAALAVDDARAGNSRFRLIRANATSFCQSALPVFDGNIRKRPLAVQNEGDASAFVTCSFTGQATELDLISVFAINNTSVAVPLTCTGVTGDVNTSNTYTTKTISIPAFDITGVGWSGVDYGGSVPGVGLFSVSCNLAPGVGITSASIEFLEYVGG